MPSVLTIEIKKEVVGDAQGNGIHFDDNNRVDFLLTVTFHGKNTNVKGTDILEGTRLTLINDDSHPVHADDPSVQFSDIETDGNDEFSNDPDGRHFFDSLPDLIEMG